MALQNLKIVFATIGGTFLGIIAGNKLPSKMKDFLNEHDIMPFLLIFVIGLLSLENDEMTVYNIGIMFAISVALGVIMYFSYDYLHEKMMNMFWQRGVSDEPAYNPRNEQMSSLKLQRALNKLPWFSPARPSYLQLN